VADAGELKEKKRAGLVMVDSFHNQPLLCRCCFLPGQGAKAEETFAAYLQSGEGKIKLFGGFFSPAGCGGRHTVRNRAESIRTHSAQPASVLFSMSLGKRRTLCAVPNGSSE